MRERNLEIKMMNHFQETAHFQDRLGNKHNIHRHSYFDTDDEASAPSDYKEIEKSAPRQGRFRGDLSTTPNTADFIR